MEQYALHWPQFYTATILEWKSLLSQDKYKQVIIKSLQYLTAKKKITLCLSWCCCNELKAINLSGYAAVVCFQQQPERSLMCCASIQENNQNNNLYLKAIRHLTFIKPNEQERLGNFHNIELVFYSCIHVGDNSNMGFRDSLHRLIF